MARFSRSICALAAAAVAPLPAARAAGSPLNKVLELLDGLSAKIVKEGEAELKAYNEYVAWCDDTAKTKEFEIKTATSRKEKLEADIEKLTADAAAASTKIEELVASIATDSQDLKSATAIREKEFADFSASEAELVDSVDTLSRAIAVIEREMRKNPAAFAQMDTRNVNSLVESISAIVDAASFSTADKQRLTALVQARDSDGDGDLDAGAPAAAAYSSHSSGIVDTLEDLKEKAQEQLDDLRKAEVNAKHNYEMLKQGLEDQVAADTKAKDDQQAGLESAKEGKAVAEGELENTKKLLADGQAALSEVQGDCITTAADHEATTHARAAELKAIADAKTALEESTSGAASQTYALLQTGSSMRTDSDLARAEVVTLVRKLAKAQHSTALAQLAQRIAAVQKFSARAGEDPFAKVKSLISDMLAKLQAQSDEAATEKAYCDEQLAKTAEKRGELEADLAKLTSKSDQASARSLRLKEDVKLLQAELGSLRKSQAEMDKIRYEEHEAFTTAKTELEQGLQGVRKALEILRNMYGADASASMLQQPAPPQQHEKATGAGTSIIGLLEVVESDFATSLAKEETEESDAKSEYDKTSHSNEVTKKMKEQDEKYATQEYKGLDKTIAELAGDRDSVSTELAAVMDYDAKIKARCIAKPESYEEKTARREAEIAGLKDALRILADEVAFTQRGRRGAARGHAFLGPRA